MTREVGGSGFKNICFSIGVSSASSTRMGGAFGHMKIVNFLHSSRAESSGQLVNSRYSVIISVCISGWRKMRGCLTASVHSVQLGNVSELHFLCQLVPFVMSSAP